jgi:ankyrin repeat protein
MTSLNNYILDKYYYSISDITNCIKTDNDNLLKYIFKKSRYKINSNRFLYIAHTFRSLKCLKVLLNNDTDPNFIFIDGMRLIHYCCLCDYYELLELLITYKVNIHNINNKMETPIYIASENNSIKCLNRLIKMGGDLNLKNWKNISPIEIACQEYKFEVIDLLLKYNVKIESYNKLMDILIYSKIYYFNSSNNNKLLSCFKTFLSRGANLYITIANMRSYNLKMNFFINKQIKLLMNTQKKLEFEFMNIIYSNSTKHPLTNFFKINNGLRRLIGRNITSYVNAF